MANAIRSLYLVRNQIPLKVRIDVFKTVLLSHLSFSGVFFQTLTAKNINRINRQIKWEIKVCVFRQKFNHSIDLLIEDRILPAELFISKFSLTKLQTDIRHCEKSKNFKMFTIRHNARQNMRKNQIIIKKKMQKKWSNKFLILNGVQKWNKLPSSIGVFDRVFARSTQESTRYGQIGAFKSHFTYENEQP